MRLFISYARVDKYFCAQIVDILDVHEVWFDNRLHAGQAWWDQINRQLKWCEGFVYLLSPDSVSSTYCRQEFEIARSLGKHIFPILIQARTPLPDDLRHIQYVDMSSGVTTEAVKSILNSILILERQGSRQVVRPVNTLVGVGGGLALLDLPESTQEAEQFIEEAAAAFHAEEYDRAVFLLNQARASGYQSRYIDLEAILHKAEDALEMQAYRREAAREYAPISVLVKFESTRKLGCQAFHAFRQPFPDYDPDHLAEICLPFSAPVVEWCEIPAGDIKLKRNGKIKSYYLDTFEIGKYPVTNAQFAEFIDAPDGYANEDWWDYSLYALRWRRKHPEAIRPKLAGHDHPCVNVCWYEALAFSRWLSDRSGRVITLPTEPQWQRAAQGDDGRVYPWGDTLDLTLCNTRESKKGLTVPVTNYPGAASPFDVWDMAGNAWEWCLDVDETNEKKSAGGDENRIIKGGSYIGDYVRAQTRFYFSLDPQCRFNSIGFRLVRLKE